MTSSHLQRRAAILSGGTASYMARPHDEKLVAVGEGVLAQLHQDLHACRERVGALEKENEALRQTNASQMGDSALKRELAALRAHNLALESAIAVDKAMVGDGPLQLQTVDFLDERDGGTRKRDGNRFINGLLASRLMHREEERTERALAAEVSAGEARLRAALREVARLERETDELVGARQAPLGGVWAAAQAFEARFGPLRAHEAEWDLETWIDSAVHKAMPSLLAQVPFAPLFATAPRRLRDTPPGQRALLWALGSNPANRDAFMAALRRGGIATLLDRLGDVLWRAIEQFAAELERLATSRAEQDRVAERAAHDTQQVAPERVSRSPFAEGSDSEEEDAEDVGTLGARPSAEEVGHRKAAAHPAVRTAATSDLPAATNLAAWCHRAEGAAKAQKRVTALERRHPRIEQVYPAFVVAGHVAPLHDPRLRFSALSEIVGAVSAFEEPMSAMELEHSRRADSRVEFTALCGGLSVVSTSEVEWLLVRDPSKALSVLHRDAWLPGERTPIELGFRAVHALDAPALADGLADVNARLKIVGDSTALDEALVVACRMYTGPAGFKYWHVMRRAHTAAPGPPQDDMCRGNQYPTTIFHVCKGIEKLSQLSRATPVYAAPAWSPLEASAFKPCWRGHVGEDGGHASVQLGAGVELTHDRAAARHSAMALGSALLFEVHQSSTLRGANLEFLTQCPAAMGKECVSFSPAMSFDLVTTRVDGAFTVVELRPTARPLAQFQAKGGAGGSFRTNRRPSMSAESMGKSGSALSRRGSFGGASFSAKSRRGSGSGGADDGGGEALVPQDHLSGGGGMGGDAEGGGASGGGADSVG